MEPSNPLNGREKVVIIWLWGVGAKSLCRVRPVHQWALMYWALAALCDGKKIQSVRGRQDKVCFFPVSLYLITCKLAFFFKKGCFLFRNSFISSAFSACHCVSKDPFAFLLSYWLIGLPSVLSSLSWVYYRSIPSTIFFFNKYISSYPGTTTKAVNLASYNYLGFAENSGPCAEAAEQAVREYGIAGCSSRHEYGEWTSQADTRGAFWDTAWFFNNSFEINDILRLDYQLGCSIRFTVFLFRLFLLRLIRAPLTRIYQLKTTYTFNL